MSRASQVDRQSVSTDALRAGALALTRDRDAWFVIRGFVYQVDLTVLRWLTLREAEALLLERGEDIDVVTEALGATGATHEQERLLEQVKRRDANVTLRSGSARAALANFHEHRRENDRLRLRFRFTTTAAVGREQRSPMPGKLPGISAWQQLQADALSADHRTLVLAGLRALLRHDEAPEELPTDVWDRYQAWVRDGADEALLAFVRDFEWATEVPDSPSLRPQIVAAVRAFGAAADERAAEEVYQRLFLAVFTRLSSPGIKRVGRADLVAELTRPTAADGALLERLRALHDVLAGRVDTLEHRVDELAGGLTTAAVAMQSLSTRTLAVEAGLTAVVEAHVDARRAVPPPLTEPPVTPRGSPRVATVHAVLHEHDTPRPRPVVVALHGAQASGKTQLALLVARVLGPRRAWVSFLDLDAKQAGERLALAIEALRASGTGTPPAAAADDAAAWEARCGQAAQAIDVLVLDDVPRARPGDELGRRLPGLLAACRAAGVSVITTSTLPITRLDALVPHEALVSRLVPPLTAEEVRDVLGAHGAPPAVRASGLAALVQGLVSGHPVLAQAAVEYLARHEWQVSDVVLHGVLGRQFAGSVNDETVRALLDGVTDGRTRDLLYRLTITEQEFPGEVVPLLADVGPPIDRQRERFTSVVGPWVERVGDDQYRLSALLRTLGDGDLGAVTRRECHLVLARNLVGRRRLGALEAVRAIGHFAGGEEFDNAALVLLQALHALVYTKRASDDAYQLWRAIIPPPRARAPLRAQVHALRAVLAHRAGEDAGPTLALTARALDEADAVPAWAVFASSLTVVLGFAADAVTVALPFVRRALGVWPDLPADLRQVLRVDRGEAASGIGTLVWLCAGGVRTPGELDAWLETLAAVPPELRARPLEETMASPLMDRIALREWRRPAGERDWRGAAAALASAARAARALGSGPLEAAATATRITCVLEAGGDVELTAREVEAAMTRFADDPDSAFLIARHLALAARDRGATDIAVAWLRRARDLPGDRHGVDRVHIRLRLADTLLGQTPGEAISLAEEAVRLARRVRGGFLAMGVLAPEATDGADEPRGSESDAAQHHAAGGVLDAQAPPTLVQALGELAIVRWKAGDRRGAVPAVVEAVEVLLSRRVDEDEDWRALFMRVGHVSGYFTTVLTTGTPPQHTVEGADYVAPFPGLFLVPDNAPSSVYRPERASLIGVQVMLLLESINDHGAAVRWAHRAGASLKAEGMWTAAVVPLGRLIRDAIERLAFDEAFGHGLDMLAAFWVARDLPEEDRALTPGPIPKDTLGTTSDEPWRQLNVLMLDHVLLPAFLQVASCWTEDRSAGARAALALRDACRRQAEETPASPVWPAAVRLCDLAFSPPANAAALEAVTEPWREAADLRTLGVVALQLASLDERGTPEQALAYQLRVAQYIQAKLALGTYTFERIALPFYERFWRDQFERQRFRFRAPGVVAVELEDGIAAAAPGARLQRLLAVISRGLGVMLPPGLAAWMGSPPRASD